MVKQVRKRPSTAKGGSQRKKRGLTENDEAGYDAFFLASDDEGRSGRDASGDEEDTEDLETAEEKRLRLAKAYLQQLRASGMGSNEEATEDEEEAGHDALAEKLKQQAQEAGGYLQKRLADRVLLTPDTEASTSGRDASRFIRCHRHAVTALAMTYDDTLVYSVGKDGAVQSLDVETGSRSTFAARAKPEEHAAAAASTGPDWVKKGPRLVGTGSLLAAAISSDGQLLAVGGGDKKVHVWDARSQQHVQSFPGHKDMVTGLAFRHGTHELFSASFDRTVKIWSLDDRAYVDTLFGHQSEVLAVDALRQERVLSTGHDHTCRVWKVPEESQLIYRAPGMAVDCCRYVTGTEWVTGSSDGTLALWSQLKKKPAWMTRTAHSGNAASGVLGESEASWIQSVAVCRGSDLVASGAADGQVRLWAVQKAGTGSGRRLAELGGLPARGFVNALEIASTGRFLVAGLGQEPRLGRWARDCKAKSGILIHPIPLADE